VAAYPGFGRIMRGENLVRFPSIESGRGQSKETFRVCFLKLEEKYNINQSLTSLQFCQNIYKRKHW